jgi:hypothetical protein
MPRDMPLHVLARRFVAVRPAGPEIRFTDTGPSVDEHHCEYAPGSPSISRAVQRRASTR